MPLTRAIPNLVPAVTAGNYYCPVSPYGTSTGAMTNGALRLASWRIDRTISIDRIGGEVTGAGEAGSKLRLGIYADTGSCFPGALILDAGQIAGDSATVQELTVALTLAPGIYWIGACTQASTTTPPTVRIANNWSPPVPIPLNTPTPSANVSAIGLVFSTAGQGALPNPAPASFSTSGSIPRLFVRAA